MITVIHGDDISNSRKFFADKKDNDSISFDAINTDLADLKLSLQGNGLFQESKKIFIENLFNKKASKNLDGIIEIINSEKNAEIYIYNDKEIGKASLKALGNYEEKAFKIPNSIFAFVDSIKPNNNFNVTSFQNALTTTDVEIIFAMIVRQFRLLIGIKINSSIDEVKRLAPWQKSKLEKQAQLFDETKLNEIYKKLYKIDKETKTGKTNLTLTQSIDIFLLQI